MPYSPSFEFRIGWRCLYRGTLAQWHLNAALACVLIAACGGLCSLLSTGGSGWGILACAVGLTLSLFFGLLAVFSVFSSVAILGVVLGTAAIVMVFAVTSGVQSEFRDKVLGVNAHVVITKGASGFANYREVAAVARAVSSNVLASEPFFFVQAQVVHSRGHVAGVALKGVDVASVRSVLDVGRHMVAGSIDALQQTGEAGERPALVIGKGLAERLHLTVGDALSIALPPTKASADWTQQAEAVRHIEFEVGGIFYCGFDEYDRRLAYVPFKTMQRLMEVGDRAMGVELRLRDAQEGSVIAARIARELGGSPWTVKGWLELNQSLFTALSLQRIVLTIILLLIMVVALFNLVSALAMMVIDKVREVAILRSMGASTLSVGRVFQTVGLLIGGLGTAGGLLVGLTTSGLLSRYDYRLDPEVYLIDHLPISVQFGEVLMVAAGTVLLSALVTWFPAAQAASLAPVAGVR